MEDIHDILYKYPHKIFCGDFNFDSSQNLRKKDKTPLENDWMTKHFKEYDDIWPLLHPNDKGYTYDTKANIMIRKRKTSRKRYDRIMCSSSSWKPQSISLFGNTQIDCERDSFDPLYLSDHFGLISEFTLRE